MKGQLPNKSNRVRENMMIVVTVAAGFSDHIPVAIDHHEAVDTEAPLDFSTITAHSVESRSRFIRSVTQLRSRSEKASNDLETCSVEVEKRRYPTALG